MVDLLTKTRNLKHLLMIVIDLKVRKTWNVQCKITG